MWLKQQLLRDYGVVQFVLCKGDSHNAYGTASAPNYYDHIEPFFRLYTDHDRSDSAVYGDDVVAHGSDYAPDGEGNLGYFRPFSSLLDGLSMAGNCSEAGDHYGENEMYPCLYTDVVYGYAMTGLDSEAVASGRALPLTLRVNTTDEPDVRSGEAPVLLQGTLSLSGLQTGVSYAIYRWDSYEAFPTAGAYANSSYAQRYAFSAQSETFEMIDDNLFLSDSSVVYSCIEED